MENGAGVKRRWPREPARQLRGRRLPVGQEVVARTSRSIRHENLESDNRLADTQVLISYRGSNWIENATSTDTESTGPLAGDLCARLQRPPP